MRGIEILFTPNKEGGGWADLFQAEALKLLFPTKEWPTPDDVKHAFTKVLKQRSTGSGVRTGRRPTRLERVTDLFLTNTVVDLDELETCFEGNDDPRHDAATTVKWLNKSFENLGEDLVIDTITITRHRDLNTLYYFRRRSPRA